MKHRRNGMVPRNIAVLLIAGTASLGVSAAEDPVSPHTLTSNVSLVSQYVARGIAQSWGKPALQGGFDYSHASGWYASFWASNVTANQYARATLEMDLAGGYVGKIGEDISYNVGVVSFSYPGANYKYFTPGGGADKAYDTVEMYGSASWKWLTLKYSRTLTDYYGFNGSTAGIGAFVGDSSVGINPNKGTKGSGYFELNANVDVGAGFALNGHLGRQTVTHSTGLNYMDYRFGATRSFDGGWSLGLAVTGTHNAGYYNRLPSAAGNTSTYDLGKNAVIFSVGRAM